MKHNAVPMLSLLFKGFPPRRGSQPQLTMAEEERRPLTLRKLPKKVDHSDKKVGKKTTVRVFSSANMRSVNVTRIKGEIKHLPPLKTKVVHRCSSQETVFMEKNTKLDSEPESALTLIRVNKAFTKNRIETMLL